MADSGQLIDSRTKATAIIWLKIHPLKSKQQNFNSLIYSEIIVNSLNKF